MYKPLSVFVGLRYLRAKRSNHFISFISLISMLGIALGVTTLIIAHRLSTVQGADKIFVLSQGQLEETGTHRELLEHGGLYRRLYDLQRDEGAVLLTET